MNELFLVAYSDYDGVHPLGVYSSASKAQEIVQDYYPGAEITPLKLDEVPARKAFTVFRRRLQVGGVPEDAVISYTVGADDALPLDLVCMAAGVKGDDTIIVHVHDASEEAVRAKADRMLEDFQRTNQRIEQTYSPITHDERTP